MLDQWEELDQEANLIKHILNFVETKKAILNGVKAGHLSYLGDCSIDEEQILDVEQSHVIMMG